MRSVASSLQLLGAVSQQVFESGGGWDVRRQGGLRGVGLANLLQSASMCRFSIRASLFVRLASQPPERAFESAGVLFFSLWGF